MYIYIYTCPYKLTYIKQLMTKHIMIVQIANICCTTRNLQRYNSETHDNFVAVA